MKRIFITGSTGFVGGYFLKKHLNEFSFKEFKRNSEITPIDDDIVLHFAGLAHDLKKVSKPQDYYETNTELTIKLYNEFLSSNASTFIFLSSIKAVADYSNLPINEETERRPQSVYGLSKKMAEDYILNKKLPSGKRYFIIRTPMIYGNDNKGNLQVLYNFISKFRLWPFTNFKNKKSFCSIENLDFALIQLIENQDISSGVYNVADDEVISTNQLIELIGNQRNIKIKFLKIPKNIILLILGVLKLIKLSQFEDKIRKLTESYEVDNTKIKLAVNETWPMSTERGLRKVFDSFREKI